MLRVAICDDERIIREEIVRFINEYSKLRGVDIICDQYASGNEFLRANISYHIAILDYQLDKDENLNGLAVAQKLRVHKNELAIIFLTNHPKVVFSSFEVDTFRFLVKPLNPQKLYNALDAFLNTLDMDSTLMIQLEGAVNIINTKNISFLEGAGKYCIIHINKQAQSIDCRETLASVGKRLPEDHFCRCHRSFIVNLKYVQSFDHQELTLHSGDSIAISRKGYKEFVDKFIWYTKRYGY